MESASAQPAAAKPQFLSLSPPMAQPDAGRPPMEMTTAELESAIAALPAKKDALLEAFDRLAACSPIPLPFTWDDLDAHISSLHSSISLRFRQLRLLEVAWSASAVSAPATTGDDEKDKNQEEEVEQEEEQETDDAEEKDEVVVEVEEVEEEEVEEEAGEEEVDANGQVDEEQKADEEMLEAEEEEVKVEDQVELVANDEADGKEQNADKEGKAEDEQDEAANEMREANEEQQDAKKKVSPEQCIQEEKEEAKKVSSKQRDPALEGANKDLLAACTSMDSARLVEIVCKNIGKRLEYAMAMRYAPDGAALVLRVVGVFLPNKQPKANRVWENFVWLLRYVPVVTPKLSVHMMEPAKQLAVDWKRMIDNPGSCEDLGMLASWALLHFLISYNIVSEFNVDEIIRLFGTVPRKQQRKDCIELCKGLGLVSRITDLIDYLIGNGQQLGVIHMTRILNLEDKYPPLSLLEAYVEKAKGIALELLSKNASHKSRNLAISKEVVDLWAAHNMVKKQQTDSSQQSVMLEEIQNLLAKYKKNQSLTNASTASTSNSQQQQKTQQKLQQQKKKQKLKDKKRKKEQQQHEGQYDQLQGKQKKLQRKQEQQQTKPQEQQQQGHKPQESKGQQQHQPQDSKGQQQHKPQQRQQQYLNRLRPCTTRLPTPVVPAPDVAPLPIVAQIGPFGRPPYAVIPGAHSYPAQPGLPGTQGGPFAANVGAPNYIGSFNPHLQNPFCRHPSLYPR